MGPIFTQIIVNSIRREKAKGKNRKKDEVLSPAEFQKALKEFKRLAKKWLKDFILISIGVGLAARVSQTLQTIKLVQGYLSFLLSFF